MNGNIFIDKITGRYNYNPHLSKYFNTGDIHIIFGEPFGSGTNGYINYLDKLIDYLDGKSNHKIHLFLVSPYMINEKVNSLIRLCCPRNKLIIHIPAYVEDMYIVAKHYFKNVPYVRIFKEKDGPKFLLKQLEYPHGDYYLKIHYTNTGIYANVEMFETKYDSYFAGYKQDGAITNSAQAEYPELFKERIIAGFKSSTPEGILKSFKDDEDIWSFIIEESLLQKKVAKKDEEKIYEECRKFEEQWYANKQSGKK